MTAVRSVRRGALAGVVILALMSWLALTAATGAFGDDHEAGPAMDTSPVAEPVEVATVVAAPSPQQNEIVGYAEPEHLLRCGSGGIGGSGGDGGESDEGNASGGSGGDGGTGVVPTCDQNANDGAIPELDCSVGGRGGGAGDGGEADGASSRGGNGGDGGAGLKSTCEQNANGPVAPTMTCTGGGRGGSGGDGGENEGGDDGLAFEVDEDGFALAADDLAINEVDNADADGGDPGSTRGGNGGDGGVGSLPTCSQNTSA